MAKPNPTQPPEPVSMQVERNVVVRLQPGAVLVALRMYLSKNWPGGECQVPEDVARVTMEARVTDAEGGDARVEVITLSWSERE